MFGLTENCLSSETFEGWGKIAETSPESSALISVGWSVRGTNVTWSRYGFCPQYLSFGTSTACSWENDLTFQGPPENGIELFISVFRSGLEALTFGNAAFS